VRAQTSSAAFAETDPSTQLVDVETRAERRERMRTRRAAGNGMAESHGTRTLMFGATGGCGSQVLIRLLERGVATTVVVRDAARLPQTLDLSNPLLTVVVEPRGHLALSERELMEQLGGVDSVVSCLGHNLTLSGMFGRNGCAVSAL